MRLSYIILLFTAVLSVRVLPFSATGLLHLSGNYHEGGGRSSHREGGGGPIRRVVQEVAELESVSDLAYVRAVRLLHDRGLTDRRSLEIVRARLDRLYVQIAHEAYLLGDFVAGCPREGALPLLFLDPTCGGQRESASVAARRFRKMVGDVHRETRQIVRIARKGMRRRTARDGTGWRGTTRALTHSARALRGGDGKWSSRWKR